MNKKLFHQSVVLIILTIGLTSCMVQNYSPFVPKFPHEKKVNANSRHYEKNKRYTDKILFALRNLDTINPVLSIGMGEILTTSTDMQLISLAKQENPMPSTLSPTLILKNEENTVLKSNPVENNSVLNRAELKNYNLKSSHQGKAKLLRELTHGGNNNRLLCGIVAFFFPPLGVALYENKITTHFWIALILWFLFWLPGFIYALVIILS